MAPGDALLRGTFLGRPESSAVNRVQLALSPGKTPLPATWARRTPSRQHSPVLPEHLLPKRVDILKIN